MNSRILDLIKKLIRHERSARKCSTAEEASAFAAKIQQLCIDHKIAAEQVCVGCVGLELNGRRSISFRQLFVAEKYRRLGIGRELVRLCEQRARSAGYETLGAIVAAGNYRVLPFYQRQGFIVAYEYDDGDLLIVKQLVKQ